MSTLARQTSESRPQPNAVYKLVVRSAEEAVRTIRAQLGEHAKVLSVRQLPGQGLAGLFGRPRLEVIAQIGSADTGSAAIALAEENRVTSASSSVSGSETLERAAATDRSFSAQATLSRSGAVRGETRSRVDFAATKLPDLLRRSGFSESLVARLQATPSFATDTAGPLHRALADFGQALRSTSTARPVRPLPSRVAFLGTSGSGRTTALCKWLARGVFVQGRTGRVVKAEFDRPNPTEGLGVFCEALGLTLDHYVAGEAQVQTLANVAAEQFLYVDLPALSLGAAAENAALVQFLATERIDGRVLVLNALYDVATLRTAYAAGRDAGATHLVFTHLDELGHWGKLWDFLIDGELTPLFLATGASLTGDFEEDAVGAVLRKTLPGS